MTILEDRPAAEANHGPKPVFEGGKRPGEQLMLYVFVIVPFVAFLAAVPVAWGWGFGWTDLALFLVFYYVSGLGITVGYHRLFTHGSFKANRPLRIGLAIAGSMAIEGPVIRWVADHRRRGRPRRRERRQGFQARRGDTLLSAVGWGTRTRTETARLQRPAGCRLPHPPTPPSA